MKRIFAFLLLSTLAFTACSPSSTVNFNTLQEGDVFGNMSVTNIDVLRDGEDLSAWNANLTFEGDVTLSGSYYHTPTEDPFYNNHVCVKDVSGAGFPVIEDGVRSARFCFNDQNSARELFESNPGEEGTAQFTISQYKWIGVEGETVNWGELGELIEKELTVEGIAPVVEELEEEVEEETSEDEEEAPAENSN